MVTLPENLAVAFNQGAEQIVAGATSVACLLFNVPLPENPSVSAGHGLGLKNASKELNPTSDVLGLNLAGGVTAVKKVYVLTYTGQPTADQTITIGGETFTAKASASTDNEFSISGVDAKTTYDNLVAKVLILTSTALATGVNSGSGANGTVTFTANTAGTTFAASETLANATGAETVANVAGVKASILITLEGSVYAGVLDKIRIPVTSAGKTREVIILAKAASSSSGAITKNSSQAGTQLAGLLLTLQNCINGVAATEANQYLSSLASDTETDCTAFLVLLFGTASSFTITGNQLKIEAGATGANGNNIKIYTEVNPSAMSTLPIIASNGIPQFSEGEVVHSGIFDETKLSAAIQELLIKGSNAFGNIVTIPGDVDDSFSIKLFINNSPEFIAKLLRNGAVTYDTDRTIFTSTSDVSTRKIGLFLAIKSKTKKGAWNCLWLYDVEITGSVDQNFSLRDVAGYTLGVRVNQDLERSGDPKFARWNARTLAA